MIAWDGGLLDTMLAKWSISSGCRLTQPGDAARKSRITPYLMRGPRWPTDISRSEGQQRPMNATGSHSHTIALLSSCTFTATVCITRRRGPRSPGSLKPSSSAGVVGAVAPQSHTFAAFPRHISVRNSTSPWYTAILCVSDKQVSMRNIDKVYGRRGGPTTSAAHLTHRQRSVACTTHFRREAGSKQLYSLGDGVVARAVEGERSTFVSSSVSLVSPDRAKQDDAWFFNEVGQKGESRCCGGRCRPAPPTRSAAAVAPALATPSVQAVGLQAACIACRRQWLHPGCPLTTRAMPPASRHPPYCIARKGLMMQEGIWLCGCGG